MKKIYTSLLVAMAFCMSIIAAVQTELRMHVFQEGDKGGTYHIVQKIDSVKFTYDTLEFKVTFNNWDGAELQTEVLQSGVTPEYKGEKAPERAQTAKYTYDFKDWVPEIGEVQKEATYTADYDSTIRKYGVVFMAQNGDILFTDYLDYGTMPTYTGTIPAKESTKLYDYNPVWEPALAEVTGDVAYKASYDSTKHIYKIVINDYDGKELSRAEGTFDYDPPFEPTREATSDYIYTFKEWKLDESKISDNTLIYTAVYDSVATFRKDGALIKASYKVSSTRSVYFSQGNLQFNAVQGTHAVSGGTSEVAGTWRFAEKQYEYIGDANSNISSTYDGWIDLFGWGTSGWNSGATAYQPWSTSESYSDYYPGKSYNNGLTGSYAKADWGVYNAISNGGNEPNKWRTLTTSEWQYLFQNNKWTLGYVKDGSSSYLCFMLIPATFTEPEGTTVTVLSTSTSSTSMSKLTVPSTNTYTTEQFAALERLGVVAFPCGGIRYGTTMGYVGSYGIYWSSSAYDSYYAYVFLFDSTRVYSDFSNYRYYGRSVRLVQDL